VDKLNEVILAHHVFYIFYFFSKSYDTYKYFQNIREAMAYFTPVALWVRHCEKPKPGSLLLGAGAVTFVPQAHKKYTLNCVHISLLTCFFLKKRSCLNDYRSDEGLTPAAVC
jgi:hypothetical protein